MRPLIIAFIIAAHAPSEDAPRALCRARNITPDSLVIVAPAPSTIGYVPAVMRYEPAWMQAQKEIEQAEQLQNARGAK